MTTSTLVHKRKESGKKRRFAVSAAAVIFWLAVWQAAAMLIGKSLLLASPVSVAKKLAELCISRGFYSALGASFLHIAEGAFLAMAAGSLLAALAFRFGSAEALLRPLMGAIKAAPVASFVVLALLAVGSEGLSVLISFMMVLPIFYTGLLAGMNAVEPERFEAAEVFGMLRRDRFRFIYLPYLAPQFAASCELAIGTAWKAGVAAEVIGIVSGSVGGALYDAKLSLETDTLFAYTIAVIIISLILEKLAVRLVRLLERVIIG